MDENVSFSSKLKHALEKPFQLLADETTFCISKKSALAHLLLCKTYQTDLARDDEQIKTLVDLIFQEADLNDDGKITLDEAFEAVSRLSSNGLSTDIEAISKEEQDALLGTIERYTAQLSLDSRTSGTDRLKQLKDLGQVVFSALDTDKSGFLEKGEAKQAVLSFFRTKLGMTGSMLSGNDMPINELVDSWVMPISDKDGDGKISFDEFFRAAIKQVVVGHCNRLTGQNPMRTQGLDLDLPNFIDADLSGKDEMIREGVFDDETAAAWLGAMPVVLFTQFKLVVEGYGCYVRGIEASPESTEEPGLE